LKTSETRDLIIVGGGPAGLTAAIYGARAALNTLLIEKAVYGGQISLTNDVENYPGFPEGVSGPELSERFRAQAEKFGARFENDEVQGLEVEGDTYVLKGYDATHRARAVILATGADPRRLNVPGEERYVGRGVSWCATCDGFFFRGKHVVVVGGGDAAVEEGMFLTKFADTVTVVHRRDTLRANPLAQKRAFENAKMKFVWNSVVEEITGDDQQVKGVRVRNFQTGGTTEISTDGVFEFIGHIPNTRFLRGGPVKLREDGYIDVEREIYTSVPGVFACGDVSDYVYRQVSTCVGSGTMAAMAAQRYLEQRAGERKEAVTAG